MRGHPAVRKAGTRSLSQKASFSNATTRQSAVWAIVHKQVNDVNCLNDRRKANPQSQRYMFPRVHCDRSSRYYRGLQGQYRQRSLDDNETIIEGNCSSETGLSARCSSRMTRASVELGGRKARGRNCKYRHRQLTATDVPCIGRPETLLPRKSASCTWRQKQALNTLHESFAQEQGRACWYSCRGDPRLTSWLVVIHLIVPEGITPCRSRLGWYSPWPPLGYYTHAEWASGILPVHMGLRILNRHRFCSLRS